jgi:hypothetical protein
VDLDDLSANRERVGEPDGLAAGQQVATYLGNRRLSVSWRPVEKQRCPGVDDRTHTPVKVLGKHQLVERPLDLGRGDAVFLSGLDENDLGLGVQIDRGRPDV